MSIRELLTDSVTGAFEPELANPEPCSCDEALALRAELKATRTELARTRFVSTLRGKVADGWGRMLDRNLAELAEANNRWHSACDVGRRLERRNAELGGALAEAEVKIDEATAREVSLVDAANQLSRELAEAKAAVEVAEKRACDEALTHDNLLEEVESYRNRFLAEQEKRVASEERASLNFRMYDKAAIDLAEAKRAAETWEELAHGQEVLGKQADALVERFKALALDATAKMNAMEVSMNAAYTERNRLVALVARICKPTAGIRRTAIEGWDPAWHGCVFIDTSQGQMSWHYHDSDAHLFADLPAYEKPWDGHTTAEKYERLWRLTELTAAIP